MPRSLAALFALLLFPALLFAQPRPAATLTGTITDAATGTPLAGAHVFIAASMIGTISDGEGRYRLEQIPVGAHRLYVSMLGFEPVGKDLMLREPTIYINNFSLSEAVLEVGEVTVEAKEDKRWQRRLEKFTRLFIGETPNAEQTKIVNPEVLDFTDKVGRFEARASAPLIIENRALGYRVQYFLKDFVAEATRTRYDGEPLFEELEPEDETQATFWEENRKKAFTGSFRHFLLALLAERLEPQGFMVYSRPSIGAVGAGTFQQSTMGDQRFPLDANDIFKPGEVSTEKILEFDGFVEIIYRGELEDPSYLEWHKQGFRQKPKFQTSWINLERGPALFDYKGDVLDPYGVTFYGYLAFERIADEVPKEYRPGR